MVMRTVWWYSPLVALPWRMWRVPMEQRLVSLAMLIETHHNR
jgi:hypothetical protein